MQRCKVGVCFVVNINYHFILIDKFMQYFKFQSIVTVLLIQLIDFLLHSIIYVHHSDVE